MFRRPCRRTVAALLLSASALAAVPSVADAGGRSSNAVYRVTIENVSTGSQPLSPAGVVVHNRKADVWSVGSPATAAVAAIAEDASLGIFVDAYRQTRGVSQSFVGGDAPFGPVARITIERVG
jgi:hypothetical protein